MTLSGAFVPPWSVSMRREESQPRRIAALPADKMPPPIKLTPEEAAKIAEFDKQLGPTFVKALNQQVLKD